MLGAIFLIVSFVVMSVAGIAGGMLRRALVHNQRIGHWTRYGAGAVMVALGIRLAFEERI